MILVIFGDLGFYESLFFFFCNFFRVFRISTNFTLGARFRDKNAIFNGVNPSSLHSVTGRSGSVSLTLIVRALIETLLMHPGECGC